MVASSNKGLSQALATIEELPQQLEEALQQTVVTAVTDMKSSLLELCNHIQAAPGAESELATQLAVERIGRIPDQIMQEINGTVAEVKESIEAKMESFVMYQAQPEGSPVDRETLVSEMSLIPTQVEEIARGVVDSAIDDTSLKAVAQMDRALASLPTRDTQLAEARSQVMAALPGKSMMNSMSNAAEEVAKTNVEDAIASARGKRSFTATENKNVANLIMSSKAEMSGQPQHRYSAGSESMTLSWVAQRSSTNLQGSAPTPWAARSPQDNFQSGASSSSSATHGAPIRYLGAKSGAGGTICNAGSVGHPEMCKKPCLFFQDGRCQQHTSCCFCHYSHRKRTNHLDKRNRELLTKLSVSSRIQILLHAMRSRAQMLPFEKVALEFVDTLDSQCGEWRGMKEEERDLHFDKGFQRLRSALLGQVFSSLASLFFKVTSEEIEPAAVARMKQAFAKFQHEIERLQGGKTASDNSQSARSLQYT